MALEFARQLAGSRVVIDDGETTPKVRRPASCTTAAAGPEPRIWNSETGHVVIVIGGLYTYGTQSAGEFLTDRRLMQTILKAGIGWLRRSASRPSPFRL